MIDYFVRALPFIIIRWRVADPSIWVHCLGKHQPIQLAHLTLIPDQNPVDVIFAMFIITVNAIMASTADFFTAA